MSRLKLITPLLLSASCSLAGWWAFAPKGLCFVRSVGDTAWRSWVYVDSAGKAGYADSARGAAYLGGSAASAYATLAGNPNTFSGRESIATTTTYNTLTSRLAVAAASGLDTPFWTPAGGLQDATFGGTYAGIYSLETLHVQVKTGTPDSFRYKLKRSNSWTAYVAMTGAAQALSINNYFSGITLTWAATTGHTTADTVHIGVSQSPALTVYDAAGAVIGQRGQQTTNWGSGSTVTGQYATVGGGTGNTANKTGATVSGGESNTASGIDGVVSGGYSNTASGQNSTVGGGQSNNATAVRSTISGGEQNRASGTGATVSGGYYSLAAGLYSTSGGYCDSIVNATDTAGVIAGGWTNVISGGVEATIAGGKSNRATANYAFVGGGSFNRASGAYGATVGGTTDTAAGVASFAGGIGSNGTDSCSFAWGQGARPAKWQAVFTNPAASYAVAIDSNGARSGYELFVKGDAAISGALMLGAAVWDSITYAADTSEMYIFTRGKKATIALAAP